MARLDPNEGAGGQQAGVDLYDSGFQPDIIDVEPLVLSENDLISPTWKKIQHFLVNYLNNDRIANDESLSALETERLRGKIERTKEILGLGEAANAEDNLEDPDPGY